MLKVYLLGTMDVQYHDEPLVFRSNKIRGLFTYLVMQPGRPHRRERLASLLWSDAPESTARNNLRSAISRLRSSLDPLLSSPQEDPSRLFQVTRHTIQCDIDPERHTIDATEFQDLMAECESFPQQEWWRRASCVRWLAKAMERYQGDFLAGLSFDSTDTSLGQWCLEQREQLHRKALQALDALGRHSLAMGDDAQAQQHARHLLQLEPWNERAHQRLITSLLRTGQRLEAERQYDLCVESLREELGIEPDAVTRAKLEKPTPKSSSVFGYREKEGRENEHTIPITRTPFVGRSKDLQLLLPQLLDPDYPLISIVGFGGMGKSRLALHAALRVQEQFEGGLCVVSLATVRSAESTEQSHDRETATHLLYLALAQTLEIPTQGNQPLKASLGAYLRDKELLVLLDNFESVQAAASALLELLQEAPSLTFLVTSRERLGLHTEIVLPMKGMGMPPHLSLLSSATAAKVPSLASGWRRAEAVKLFEERARRASLRFVLSEENGTEILRICQQLEGSPLGIELAASWVDRMSCADIADALQRNHELLSSTMQDLPRRHRSIHAVCQHSWQMLSPKEQKWLAQCSLFQGSFSEEAAKAIAGVDSSDLAALASKSLLQQPSASRYALHAVLRQWLQGKLQKAPTRLSPNPDNQDIQRARERFIDHYLQQVSSLQAVFSTQAIALRVELPNVQKAWRMVLEDQRYQMIEEAIFGITSWYRCLGLNRENLDDLQHAYKGLQVRTGPEEKPLREAALCMVMACLTNALRRSSQHDEARDMAEKTIALATTVDHTRALLHAGASLAIQEAFGGDVKQSLIQCQEWYTRATKADEPALQIETMLHLCYCHMCLGEYDALQQVGEEALSLSRQEGFLYFEQLASAELATAKFQNKKPQEARTYLLDAITIGEQLGNHYTCAALRMHLALTETFLGEYKEVQRRFFDSLRYYRTFGFRRMELFTRVNYGFALTVLGADEEAEEILSCFHEEPDPNGDLRPFIYGRMHLSALALARGDLAKARLDNDVAREWAYAIHERQATLMSLWLQAWYYRQEEAWKSAEVSYQKMLTLLREGPEDAQIALPLLGLVWLYTHHLSHKPDTTIQEMLEEGFAHLDPMAIYGLVMPFEVYIDTYSAMQKLDHPDAKSFLHNTQNLLNKRAKSIESPTHKQRYLTLPTHQKLKAL